MRVVRARVCNAYEGDVVRVGILYVSGCYCACGLVGLCLVCASVHAVYLTMCCCVFLCECVCCACDCVCCT